MGLIERTYKNGEIIIKEGDNRCPLEKIVDGATTADEVVETLWAHFDEMKNKHKA